MRRLLLALCIGLIARSAFAQSTPSQTGSPTPAATETATATLTFTPSRTPSPSPTFVPTAAPTIEGFALDTLGDVLFPAAIRFTVKLSLPASELETIRLVVESEAQSAQTHDLNIDDITQTAAPEAQLAYMWPVPEEAVPPLFSSVQYRWEIEASNGEVAIAEGSVTFTDPRVIWDHFREIDGKLSIALARGLPVGLVRELVEVYELLSANTDQEPTLAFMVYDESPAPGCEIRSDQGQSEESLAVSPMSGVSTACQPEFAERVYEQGGYVPFQRVAGQDVTTTMVEHMARVFYEPLWDGNDVPLWFRVGLGLLYAPALKTDYLSVSQVLARSNRLFSLDVMNSEPPTDEDTLLAWRAQSYGMVLYIAEQAGMNGVFALANELGEGQPFVDALEEVMGQPVESLIAAWQGWLFSDAATAAYGITPYQPATPVPSPTSTATATPVPSFTLTPAPSVTGTLSPTSYPTVTSTRTLTPEPSTVTPRPPLRTPTPSPSATTLAFTPTTQIVVVALLSIVIGILVVVYIRLGRR